MCRFHGEIDSTYIPACGEAQVSEPKKNEEVLASLPFLSPASAILVLAELAKLGVKGYPVNDNFLEYSFKAGHNGIFLTSTKQPLPCYVCNVQDVDLYRQLISGTKYTVVW